MTDSCLVVVGLGREARILGDRHRVIVGASGLSAALRDRPGGLISFGLCGGLDPALRVGDILVADGVVGDGGPWTADAAWSNALRAALPAVRRGEMAGGEAIVGSPAAKAALRQGTGAAAADMESHTVARAAAEAGLPFAVLRAVSDTAERALPRSAQAGFKSDGEPDVGAVIRALAGRPWELPALIRTALEAEKAFKALERAAEALTRSLGLR